MIAVLKGKVVQKNGNVVLLETGCGIVFEVICDLPTSDELETGREASLHVVMSISQEGVSLYGFSNEQKKALFLSLLKVTGLGPRTALKIVSNEEVENVVAMIATQDVEGLSKIPGVGKKLAERIVTELKNQFEGVKVKNLSAYHEAVEALVSLGYPEKEARKVVKEVVKPGLSTSEIIRQALRVLSKR